MSVTFTLSFILIPYGLVAAIVAAFAIFNLHHLFEHGGKNGVTYGITTAFLAGAAVILLLTWQGLGQVDWRQPISLSPPLSGFGTSGTANVNAP